MAQPKMEVQFELLEAVENGKISIVQELLRNNVDEIKDVRYFDYYLIIKALRKPDVAIAKLLIDKSFRVYKKSEFEKTILHYAVELKDIDLITILLKKGASKDIVTPNEETRTPLHLAINENQAFIIELFLARLDIKTLDEKYFLWYTVQKHAIPIASQLIGDGFSLTKETKEHESFKTLDVILSFSSVKNMKRNNYDVTAPIYKASICGNLKVIKKYAKSGLPINISLTLNGNSWSCLSEYSGFTLLHFAVKYIKLEVVEFLLSIGADILIRTDNGTSPLHLAFETKEIGIWKTWKDFHDNNSIIDLLLKANTRFNSNHINERGLSHFHIACSRDEPKVVEHFLKFGASVNQPVTAQCYVYKKYSPLHFAAKFRCKKTMEVLLKNGADVKQRGYKKMTALHVAAQESCPEVVSLLLQYGAEVDSVDSYGNTPLHWAFENKSYKILDVLLSAPDMANLNPINHDGISHFHIACTRNNVDVVKKFIENGVLLDTCVPAQTGKKGSAQPPCIPDWSGYSPLHLAVCHNKPKIVQLLLDKGANVEVKNCKGFDPLYMACQYPCNIFTEFIEDILSDESKHGITKQQFNPLTDVGEVDEKYVNFNGSIDKIDWTFNRSEHLDIIKSLFCNESDVNRIDENGSTPIFWACWVTNNPLQEMQNTLKNNLGCSQALSVQIVQTLSNELRERRKLIIDHFLTLKANLNKCSQDGSILHCIAKRPDEESCEMMEFFIKRGANVNATDDEMWTPLHFVVSHGKENLVRILLDNNADMDSVESIFNSTPMLMASKFPSITSYEIIKLLVNRGANVNARRQDGTTTLHDLVSICTHEHVEPWTNKPVFEFDAVVPAIHALIKAGADVNVRDSEGHTPLHLACKNYNYHFASLLLDHGANVNVENNRGNSVCCYVYDIFRCSKALERWPDLVTQVVNVLRMHVVKMKEFGLPISKKTLSSVANCAKMVSFYFTRLKDHQQSELIKQCQAEVKVLKDTKIHDKCTLYDGMFKNENTLSHLVKNPAFEAVVKSELFEKKYSNYGYLVKLKCQEGVTRGELLPKAKWVLNRLAGLELPDACSENICKYFKNFELKESIDILCGILNSDDKKFRSC